VGGLFYSLRDEEYPAACGVGFFGFGLPIPRGLPRDSSLLNRQSSVAHVHSIRVGIYDFFASMIPGTEGVFGGLRTRALARCYDLLLGKKRMTALSHVAQIDKPCALKLMQDDVSVAMQGNHLLTQEERDKLVDEIVSQAPKKAKPVTPMKPR
jgi:hypothetical protein